jgi:hypothetical protein
MATSLTTRETAGGGATVKNAPLTNEEVDLNFISITNNKLESDNNLSDLSNATIARSNLGLEIGVDVQEFDANNATFDAVNPTFTDTGALGVPTGTQAERPGTPASGQIRFNADVNEFEGYNGTEWDSIGGGSEIQNDTSSTSDFYPTLADATTGDLEIAYVSDTKLFYQPSTGTLNATEFNSLSDAAVKTNVNEITSGLDVVNAIAGVEFDWKDNGKHSAGVIAQELERVLPHLVAATFGIDFRRRNEVGQLRRSDRVSALGGQGTELKT